MHRTTEELKARTKRFALDVVTLTRCMPENDANRALGRQLLRSATSVGANYRTACRARSRAEFVARIGVVLEEADESAFWLELFAEQPGLEERRSRLMQLLNEANQLTAIFAATRITASRIQRAKQGGK